MLSFFFSTCLLSWLEQDTSCPTCRLTLNIQNPSAVQLDSPDLQPDPQENARRPINHFFHFDGKQLTSEKHKMLFFYLLNKYPMFLKLLFLLNKS